MRLVDTLEVGHHQDVEQFVARSRTEGLDGLESLFEVIWTHEASVLCGPTPVEAVECEWSRT